MVEKSHTSGLWPALYEPFRTMGSRLTEWLAPASEASTNDNAYMISIELPGVEQRSIDYNVENPGVSVPAVKKADRNEKGATWYFSERQYGSFSRSFRLPPDADEEKVSADLKDGVLTVTVPKSKPEAASSKKVKIRKG